MTVSDHIRVNGLTFHCSVFGSPWSSIDSRRWANAQPVTFSIDIQHDIHSAAQSDDLSHSVNYSKVCQNVDKACNLGQVSDTPYGLAERVLDFVLKDLEYPTRQIDVELELPKMVLRAKSAGLKLSWRKCEEREKRHVFYIHELTVHTIVGIRPYERKDKQPVIISLELDDARQGHRDLNFDFSKVERRISDFVEASAYGTIEALTQEIARECITWLEDPASFKVTVTLAKLAALVLARAPEIRITRTLSDFPSLKAEIRSDCVTGKAFAALALGANLGDRFQNIELALRYLENFKALSIADPPTGHLEVIDTSFLYESLPQYFEKQPVFINCACLVETTMSPQDLLRVCKHIEKIVGRVPNERFGPRAIDLDIVTYGDQIIDTRSFKDRDSLDNLEGHLVIPHPRLAEREFVLRPLKDIIPEWVHPHLHRSVRSLLAQLILDSKSSGLAKVIPFPVSPELHQPAEYKTPATLMYWILPEPNPHTPMHFENTRMRRRYTMATLNVTPDSFSDGGQNNTLEAALEYASRAVAAGADIIDIGGYSTRPGAVDVPPSKEIERVVPVIQAIRNSSDVQLQNIPISIDTFRLDVARAAIEGGANVINDVYAFNGGPEYPPGAAEEAHFAEMRALAHEAGVPVVMMHSRGDAGQNKDYEKYENTGFGRRVLEGVRAELGRKVQRATKGPGALRRWQVVVDPGIGFSKDLRGNVDILRNAGSLTTDTSFTSSFNTLPDSLPTSPYSTANWNPLAGFPLLIGASRKSFLGTLLSQPLLPTHKDPDLSSSSSSSSSSAQRQTDSRSGQDRPARERDFATAAAVTCAVQQGAAILRVHAVNEMIDVVKTAAALYYDG